MKTKFYLLALIVLVQQSLSAQTDTTVVLIEEGTGTWCSWCPRGEVYGKQVLNQYSDQAVMIAIHSGDVMGISPATYASSSAFSGLPSGHINRGYSNIDPTNWGSTIASLVQSLAPVNIEVSQTYNATNQTLTIQANVVFSSNLPPNTDYGIGLVVVEDGVHGNSSSYNQSNAYSGGANGPMGGFENLPNPVPASLMVYDHVARSLVTPYDGETGVIAVNPQSGVTYSTTHTVSVPNDWNTKQLHVVGYVVGSNGVILNANKSPYLHGDKNAQPFIFSADTIYVQSSVAFNEIVRGHDADDEILTITCNNLPTGLNLTPNGTTEALLSGAITNVGTHVLNMSISDGLHAVAKDVVVEVVANDQLESWQQVGNPGMTQFAAEYHHMQAVDPVSNVIYVAAISNSDKLEVWQYDSAWTQIRNNVNASGFYGDLSVNPVTHELYLSYVNSAGSALYVDTYDGSNWTTLGTALNGVGRSHLAFNSVGECYVAFRDNNYKVAISSFDTLSQQWMSLSANHSLYDSIWGAQIAFGPNDELYMLSIHVPAPYNYYSVAHEWDGSDWQLLGGGYINADNSTSASGVPHAFAVSPVTGDLYAAIYHNFAGHEVVYHLNGNTWDTINPSIGNGASKEYDIAFAADGTLYLAYEDLNNRASCEKWNGNTWQGVGLPSFTPTIGEIEVGVFSNGKPVVSYIDVAEGGKVSVKRQGNNPVGIAGLSSNNASLRLYPNPVNQTLHLSTAAKNAKVYNMLGALIFEADDVLSVDVSQWSKGMYILKTENYSERFIVY